MMIEEPTNNPITLKVLREAAGYTQKQLGQRLNISQTNIQFWEYGQAKPKLDNAVALARELNVSLKTLAKSMGIDVTGVPDDD